MQLTADNLGRSMGCTPGVVAAWLQPLRDAAAACEITTPARLSAFVAQIGHESASLTRLEENLNYSADRLRAVWPSRFTRELAAQVAHNPRAIAEVVYGGRLGNRQPGDGWLYRGRSPIHVTGLVNYSEVTGLVRGRCKGAPDFTASPELLLTPQWGAWAACAWWRNRGLNELADVGAFDKITRRINGGDNGAADRRARYQRARGVFT